MINDDFMSPVFGEKEKWEQSLKNEYRELKDKIWKLERVVIECDRKDYRPEYPAEKNEVTILRAQICAMRSYANILEYRAELHNIKLDFEATAY